MYQISRNSCAKAFDNRSRSKNLKPKKSRGGSQFDPSRLLGLNQYFLLFYFKSFHVICDVTVIVQYLYKNLKLFLVDLRLKTSETELKRI